MKPSVRFLMWWLGLIVGLAISVLVAWGFVEVMDRIIAKLGRGNTFIVTVLTLTGLLAFLLRNTRFKDL